MPPTMGKCSLGALLVVLILAASAPAARAGINVWTSNGPPGGSIKSLAIDPQTTNVLYAGTEFAGVFKSTDRGESWAPANTGLTDAEVDVLAVDPSSPNVV